MRIVPRVFALILALNAIAPAFASDPAATVVDDETVVKKVLGGHMISMQWISWEASGHVDVTEKNGRFYIKGMQRSKSDDYVYVDGWITHITATDFTVKGTIITKVATINGGQPCGREGDFTFAVKGKNKFWRLQDGDNPCSKKTIDIIDIYFK